MVSAAASGPVAKAGVRDPQATRRSLIQGAFQEIYQRGYAGASLDDILTRSGVTKGALYHHFDSKAALAHAVIDEVIREWVVDRWLRPVEGSDDPITPLAETCRNMVHDLTDDCLACGCPLNNLSQELSNTDAKFRAHLARVYEDWQGGLAAAFERGKIAGNVRSDVDSEAAAAFVVAGIQGLAATTKANRDRRLAASVGTMLAYFVETLRPRGAAAPARSRV